MMVVFRSGMCTQAFVIDKILSFPSGLLLYGGSSAVWVRLHPLDFCLVKNKGLITLKVNKSFYLKNCHKLLPNFL